MPMRRMARKRGTLLRRLSRPSLEEATQVKRVRRTRKAKLHASRLPVGQPHVQCGAVLSFESPPRTQAASGRLQALKHLSCCSSTHTQHDATQASPLVLHLCTRSSDIERQALTTLRTHGPSQSDSQNIRAISCSALSADSRP